VIKKIPIRRGHWTLSAIEMTKSEGFETFVQDADERRTIIETKIHTEPPSYQGDNAVTSLLVWIQIEKFVEHDEFTWVVTELES
jgi:hypothetical protein